MKKVIQYLTSVSGRAVSNNEQTSLETLILQVNIILESFGNAKTIRNNNSSRFVRYFLITIYFIHG